MIARHHVKFHAYYQQPGNEAVTEEFNRKKGEYRLNISTINSRTVWTTQNSLDSKEELLPVSFLAANWPQQALA